MENITMTSGAVEQTGAFPCMWRERRQPGTRLLADLVATLPGTTLSTTGRSAVAAGQPAAHGKDAAPAFVIANYMDVSFRSGGPPV